MSCFLKTLCFSISSYLSETRENTFSAIFVKEIPEYFSFPGGAPRAPDDRKKTPVRDG